MNGSELHAKYDARLYALTHREINDIIENPNDGDLRQLYDEIGAFGYEPVEVFPEDGSTSYFGYRKLDDAKRVPCLERYAVNHLHGLRPHIQFVFRHDPSESIENGGGCVAHTVSTLVVSGIPVEKRDASRIWMKGFLDGFGIAGHVFRVQTV